MNDRWLVLDGLSDDEAEILTVVLGKAFGYELFEWENRDPESDYGCIVNCVKSFEFYQKERIQGYALGFCTGRFD